MNDVQKAKYYVGRLLCYRVISNEEYQFLLNVSLDIEHGSEIRKFLLGLRGNA